MWSLHFGQRGRDFNTPHPSRNWTVLSFVRKTSFNSLSYVSFGETLWKFWYEGSHGWSIPFLLLPRGSGSVAFDCITEPRLRANGKDFNSIQRFGLRANGKDYSSIQRFRLRANGKDFNSIQRFRLLNQSVAEIVQFYFLWKKTERPKRPKATQNKNLVASTPHTRSLYVNWWIFLKKNFKNVERHTVDQLV